jgi:spore germination protein
MGYAVLSIPKSIAENAGTGGWMVVIVGVIIIIVLAYMFVYIGTAFPNKTIDEYMPLLTGKFISYLVLIIFAVYTLFICGLIARMTSETIKLTMLINTPIWAISTILIIVPFYTMTKNLVSMARICEIFGMIIIIFGITIFITLLFTGKITNIKPFFNFSDLKFFDSLLAIGFSLTGLEILPVIPMNSNRKEISRNVLFIQLIIGFMYLLIIESCISVMGVDSIVQYDETVFATMRRIEVDGLQFLKRLDGVFLIIWLLSLYCTVLLEGYITVHLFTKLFKCKNQNLIVLIVFILSMIICLTPQSMIITKSILDSIGYIGIVINIALPLLLFSILLFKKYKKTPNIVTQKDDKYENK